MTEEFHLLPGVPLIESPLFATLRDRIGWSPQESALAQQLHERGYAVLDFLDPEIDARIERIKSALAPHFGLDTPDPATIAALGDARVQDAWMFDTDVAQVAAHPEILSLLSRLWGRRAIPFQTLNFPVGTQQHLHSDSVHFSSQPERFMCGVWLALEDIHEDAGVLEYLPGSHRWPILSNAMLGRRGADNIALASAQAPYEEVWRDMVATSGVAPERFVARKGQALIWAANLLHGGSPRIDPTRTRWSQVTHYYFEDCLYYTPAYSDEVLGQLHLREITEIGSGAVVPNQYQGEVITPPKPPVPLGKRLRKWARRRRAFGGLGARQDSPPAITAPNC